jgi:FkbM family methyltransferase
MNFSGVDSRSLLGKLLRLPLGAMPKSAIVPIMQGPLRGRRWVVGSSTHGCWLGSYEFPKQRLFIDEIKQGDVVFDIGAHVGFYTLLSSQIVGEQGQVVSFEPFPPNLMFLKRHIQLNRLKNVKVVEKAVSSRAGTMTFEIGPSSSMGHLAEQVSGKSIEVETVVLDEFVRKANLPVPDLMKIDIEGAEFDCLVGAKELLQNNRIKIFLATHGTDVHRRCLSFLNELGYELRSLSEKSLEATDEIFAIKH